MVPETAKGAILTMSYCPIVLFVLLSYYYYIPISTTVYY